MNGTKDVPVPKEEEGPTEPKQDEEGPVPPGIPEFWLGVLRANRVIGESVRSQAQSYCTQPAILLWELACIVMLMSCW